ncbi:hypothetical protein [Terricaulis silvestris]|uniref:Glycerophosphoryl diester phosphodiesterase membrane domain-containing protein n=1 Tax=Terricaulis silvestris TaxID=2686094 RepID=A0A6I6MJC0_9CAUL|nr:hypothetical protein [Terricaulis silvestris]QGZ95345.1 hypothetical protein DSM104635_02194 [Terricaulis silvestris]
MAQRLNATFFALQKRDRAILLPATLVVIAILALIFGAFVALNWRGVTLFAELFQAGATGAVNQQTGTDAVFAMFGLFGSALLLLFPTYMAVAAYEAACLRWMIRGEAPGLFGLTLDADMWRVYGVYWCWLIVQMVVSTVVSTIMVAIMFATMGDVMANPTDPAAMLQWQLMVQVPITVLQYIPLIFLGVRLGPAAATSIARKKFSFLEAWTVTKWRFWELFGSFFVLMLGYFVVFGALLVFVFASVFRGGWPGVNATPEQVANAFAAVWTLQNLMIIGGLYFLMLVTGVIYVVFSYGVNARAAIAAVDDGKIEGHTPNIGKVFE